MVPQSAIKGAKICQQRKMLWTIICFLLLANIQIEAVSSSWMGLPEHCKLLKTSLQVQSDSDGTQRARLRRRDVKETRTEMEEDDNGFEIRVRRALDQVMVSGWYEPGREYIVTLTNRYQMVGFRDAILWLEPGKDEAQMKMGMMSSMHKSVALSPEIQNLTDRCESYPERLGQWISISGGYLSMQSRPGCHGMTVERQSQIRSWVTQLVLRWRAPKEFALPAECSGTTAKNLGCVTIHAAVRVRGGHRSVYGNAGGLMKTLCPGTSRPPSAVLPAYMIASPKETEWPTQRLKTRSSYESSSNKISPMNTIHMDIMQPQDCCACGTATYNLTFQGLWTRDTHPRDWPVHNPGLLHWTNLIGASHMPSYRIYQFGEPASAGVSAVCAYGDTTVLKQSLSMAAASAGSTGSISSVPTGTQRGAIGIGPLHSLISAPGMWSETTLNESRSTLVGVNRTHPLISFLTMLGPSPNWCAGISSQSVCQADCTWVKHLEIDLFPWDAGVRHGDTYVPKSADRKDVPDPIRYITADWMPNHPFTPNKPVARVTLDRVLPKESWQCASEVENCVELFRSDGTTEAEGCSKRDSAKSMESSAGSKLDNTLAADISSGSLPKKSRSKSGGGTGGGGSGTSGGVGQGNPLSDPSLAQMATFLCITDAWSAWSPCSVTCGVGRRERRRTMLLNKKNELCQHVPLREEEPCEGRKRTCDFSSPCSLLPWTEWTPCNATCADRNGIQTRRRYLARSSERDECMHLFNLPEERSIGMVVEQQDCGPTDNECDPVTICGEGRKDGIPCGAKIHAYHYSAVDHACLPFDYLGCKGGRNRFVNKEDCERTCLKAVEELPGWRRERMALLQYQTSQIASEDGAGTRKRNMKAAKHCSEVMDTGFSCEDGFTQPAVRWYYSSRTRRCFEFVYLGCGGNANRYDNYTACISDCMPEEWEKAQQMAKALAATSKVKNPDREDSLGHVARPEEVGEDALSASDANRITSLWGPKQDCQLTAWGGWSPCSAECHYQRGEQIRWRHIERPPRHGGAPCGMLFEKRTCTGTMC
ncbi:SPONdin extracellular matrix glycoprotein [Fasciola hepatica]|uniref:SPONdin extracellular matrix glycoprotein n=1 Tax=Fasciola hepatica TaxID=6192 RepID=A0A4E0RWW2_FASHE|nr:SPONdin extracellular matrix glycoprotein [Fasciola hepatica]